MATGLQPNHLKGKNAELLSKSMAIVPVKLRSLNPSMLDGIFDSAGAQALGIAGEYLNDPYKPLVLTGLAVATPTQAFVIEIERPDSRSKIKPSVDSDEIDYDTDSEDGLGDLNDESQKFKEALRSLLRSPNRTLVAFNADRLALALYSSLDQRVSNLVDLQSSTQYTELVPRHSPNAYIHLLGGPDNVFPQQLRELFVNELQEEGSFHKLAFRALSAFLAQKHNDIDERMTEFPKIDTTALSTQTLNIISKIYGDNSQLESMKPSYTKTSIGRQLDVENGTVMAMANQYKERFRSSSQQEILIHVRDRRYPYKASIESVSGKAVKLRISCQMDNQKLDVVSLVVMGPEDPTLADTVKVQAILHVLQGRGTTLGSSISKCLWFEEVPGNPVPPHSDFLNEFANGMNDKQREALKMMLSESEGVQLPIIIGPPGTGKTTVIAAFVRALAASKCPVWVIAQSNVGVKNIVSRLMKDNFMEWRLLISKDFYQGWNEDLYRDIPPRNKIISKDFAISQTRNQLSGVRVILCTLNLLVNPKLRTCGYIFEVPLRTIVVDEASQIEVGSYLSVLATHENIGKICFFGDDKQLAPFGAEQIKELKSVFELPHLRTSAVFLDTQYRLPVAIADFISHEVYDGLLQSIHSNASRSACQFIDIAEGEEEHFGSSFRNLLEVKAVKNLAKAAANMNLDFRVVTPYEGQRSHVEGILKKSELPFEDRVFNVDSFQGNEADVIIISLVRTKKTGFLANLRRINVMLTRCKVAMFICCNLSFLQNEASDTLVGKMATEWLNAGETVVDPLKKSVKWESLFRNLKNNNQGRTTAPAKKGKGKKKYLDLSKIGYGTRIKKTTLPDGAALDGNDKNGFLFHNRNDANNSRLRDGNLSSGSSEPSRDVGWGHEEGYETNKNNEWWTDKAKPDNDDIAADGWGDDSEWKADDWDDWN